MTWFLQHHNFQIGDFVMMTSGLKAISEMNGEKVKVFFETDVVRDLYLQCKFINIASKMPSGKYFSTTMFSSWNYGEYRRKRISEKESMQECFFRMYAKEKGYKGDMPDTYVDNPMSAVLNKDHGKKYIAIFHGCLGKNFVNKKNIPSNSLQFLVDESIRCGFIPVLLGSIGDYNQYWKKIDLSNPKIVNYIGKLTIRDSASILSQCDLFISNDTGLYHVASAYKINGLVLWNDTEFYKNGVSFDGVERIICKGHDSSFYNNAISGYLKKCI